MHGMSVMYSKFPGCFVLYATSASYKRKRVTDKNRLSITSALEEGDEYLLPVVARHNIYYNITNDNCD